MKKLGNFRRSSSASSSSSLSGTLIASASVLGVGAASAQSTKEYSRDVLFEVKSDYLIKADNNVAVVQTDDEPMGLRPSQYFLRDGKLYVNAQGAEALVSQGSQVGGWDMVAAGEATTGSSAGGNGWPVWLAGVAPSTWAIGLGGAALTGGAGLLGYSLLNQDGDPSGNGDNSDGADGGDGGTGDGDGGGTSSTDTPSISSGDSASILENSTGDVLLVEASDDKDNSLMYSISGDDSGQFVIQSNGQIQLSTGNSLDFEAPKDDDSDNSYQLTVKVTDSDGNEASQDITVNVRNVDEQAPEFSAGDLTKGTAKENETATTIDQLAVVDPDASTLTYSITGGEDASLFGINAQTGKLHLLEARDLEGQSSADGDDVYEVEVTVIDGGGHSDVTQISVALQNVDEATVLTVTAEHVENVSEVSHDWSHSNVATDPDGGTPTYSLLGENADMFQVSSSGTVKWKDGIAPDFETVRGGPFAATLVATDPTDGSTSTQNMTITLVDVDDSNPEYAVGSTTALAKENQTTVTYDTPSDLDVMDDDSDLASLTYSISGGADAVLFTVDEQTGKVSFINGPNNERPADANQDKVYEVQVKVSDSGGQFDTIDVSVSVSDDDAPDDYDISHMPAYTWNLTNAFNAIDPLVDGDSGVDRLDDFKAAGIYVAHETVFEEAGDDDDIMVVFWDETGTGTNSDAGYMYLFYDNWGDVLSNTYTSYMTDSNDKYDAPMTATAYFDEDAADYFTARVFDVNNLHDKTIDYVPSPVDGSNTGTQTGLGFYEGSDGAGGYGEYFQLTTTQLMRADSDNMLEGTTISSLFGYNANYMYEAADIDADGDVDFFEYDPATDTLNFFERTDTSGFNQMTLNQGDGNPFEGLSLKQLANGGFGQDSTETLSSFAFYNVDADDDLELIVSGQTNAYVYDFT